MDDDTYGILQNRKVCGIFPDDVSSFGAEAILDGMVAVRLIKRPPKTS